MKLSVVIPLFNEAGNIRQLVQEIENVLSQANIDFEIIAVDDGSTDESYSVLQEISNNNDCVKAIHLRINDLPPLSCTNSCRRIMGEKIFEKALNIRKNYCVWMILAPSRQDWISSFFFKELHTSTVSS